MKVLDLPLDQVHVPATRLRDYDPAWAEALSLTIAEQGLLQPIVVRPRGGWWLVAGRVRLEATRLLGHVTIAARPIEVASDGIALEAEAYEHLAHQALLPLDRCRTIAELKRLWDATHPEARGGDRRSPAARAEAERRSAERSAIKTATFGQFDPACAAERRGSRKLFVETGDEGQQGSDFERIVSARSCMAWRTIRRCVTIWERLSPASRRRLVGTALAANQSELQLLSEQSDARQEAILDLVLDPASPIDGVRAALEHIEGGEAEAAAERRFRLWREGFAKLSEVQVDTFVEEHEAALIASLRRRGVVR